MTGSRSHHDRDLIRAGLVDAGAVLGRNTILVHGAAPGADTIAATIWTGWRLPAEPHPADWANCAPTCRTGHQRQRSDGAWYCPTAGNRRNADMVAAGAALWLAYPMTNSVGTRNCMRLATAAGIEVWEYRRDQHRAIARRVFPATRSPAGDRNQEQAAASGLWPQTSPTPTWTGPSTLPRTT